MQDAGKPVRPGDVAKALDVDSSMSKAIDELKKSGKDHVPRKRCYHARRVAPSLKSTTSLPPRGPPQGAF